MYFIKLTEGIYCVPFCLKIIIAIPLHSCFTQYKPIKNYPIAGQFFSRLQGIGYEKGFRFCRFQTPFIPSYDELYGKESMNNSCLSKA